MASPSSTAAHRLEDRLAQRHEGAPSGSATARSPPLRAARSVPPTDHGVPGEFSLRHGGGGWAQAAPAWQLARFLRRGANSLSSYLDWNSVPRASRSWRLRHEECASEATSECRIADASHLYTHSVAEFRGKL